MAFNITNLVNAVNAKSATVGADSALDRAVLLTNDIKNSSIYSSLDDLPTADSSNSGRLSRVGDANDANTKYYVSQRNRWNLIGLDDSDVATGGQFPPFQGSNYGYASGATPLASAIEQFSFTSDGDATDVGDLSTAARFQTVGQSSATHGYNTGGIRNPPPVIGSNIIDKFPFSSSFTTATDVGDLTVGKHGFHAGQSSIVNGFGYASGGYTGSPSDVIDKFSFSADGNATDIGDLTAARTYIVGQSSSTHGYSTGSGRIDKFSFATNGNATLVGYLSVDRHWLAGQSSWTDGYTSGGVGPPATIHNVIDKFPFSTDANATDVGDLTAVRRALSGQSSTVSGYNSGGSALAQPGYLPVNIIEKFPFASDFSGTATDVGDLTGARDQTTGQQY